MDAVAYDYILHKIEKHKRHLSPQEYRTLCGQALAGDAQGADKGLRKLLRRRAREKVTP